MSRSCAIMQPTYLPWSGYFNLMARVDVFVLLDDVQFERRSWQSRNRILVNGGEHLLTVPVVAAPRATRLDAMRTVAGPWRARHWATLSAAYAKAPHGAALLGALEPLYRDHAEPTLAAWNRVLIERLAALLHIHTPLQAASALGCDGQRAGHLLALCDALGCSDYLSPQGSRDYLAEDGFAANGRVTLRFQDFSPAPYAQLRAPTFISHLSVVDVIAHLGTERAARYVRGEP